MSDTPDPFEASDSDDWDAAPGWLDDDDDDMNLPAFDKNILFGVAFCNHIVRQREDFFGEDAIMDLLFAIDRNMQWSTEIIAQRAEVEDILLNRHGAFDHDIWNKVQETKAWSKMLRQIYKLSKKYLAEAVDEVVHSELQDTP